MASIKIKQHDITDCGAACLASIAAHYNLQIQIINSLKKRHLFYFKKILYCKVCAVGAFTLAQSN